MPALKSRFGLFLAIELREAATTTGTYQQQTGNMLPIAPTLEFEPGRYERTAHRASLTNQQDLVGIRIGRAKFGLELSASDGPNQWQDSMRCCGYADEPLGRFTIGAIAGGPFRHGELITQGSSGAFGTCVSDTWDGQTSLWVAQEFQLGFDTFDSTGVLVGAATGATATPSAFTDPGGRGWWPYSPRISIIQFDALGLLTGVTQNDQLRGATSGAVANVFKSRTAGIGKQILIERRHGHFEGSEVVQNLTTGNMNIGTTLSNGYEIAIRNCTASVGLVKDLLRERIEWARGTWKLNGKIGEPAIFDFDFLGKEAGTVDQAHSLRVDFSGIHTPPVLLGADLAIGPSDQGQSSLKHGCIREFSIDAGNDVQIQECMALTADHGAFFTGRPGGVDMAVIVGRTPTMRIDPPLSAEAQFPWMDALMNNRSLRAQLTIGATAPDRFYISMPSMSVASLGGGEYEGNSIRDVELHMDGGTGLGVQPDNEIVIVQDYG